MVCKHVLCWGFALSLALAACDEDDASDPKDGGFDTHDASVTLPDAALDADASAPDAGPCGCDAASPGGDAGEDGSVPLDGGDVPVDESDGGAEDAGVVLDAGVVVDAGSDAGEDAGVDPCLVPTTEVCNGRDDDCDGRTDEGLLEMTASDSLTVAMPAGQTLSSEQRAFADLVPAPDGHAWLLTKPLGEGDALTPLSVTTLDRQNRPVGPVQQILPGSRQTFAASLDNYLALLWRDTDNDGDASKADLENSSTYLSLFEVGANGVLTERDRYDFGGPMHLAELALQKDAAGVLHIAAVYAPWVFVNGNEHWTIMTVGIFTYDAASTSLVPVAQPTLSQDARFTAHVVDRPCGEGWFVSYWDQADPPSGRKVWVRSLSLDGELALDDESALFLKMGHRLHGFASSQECDADDVPVLMLATDGLDDLTAYELSYSQSAGTLTQVASVKMTTEFAFTHIARWGGEWYATIRNFITGPTAVFELSLRESTPRAREIAMPIDPGGVLALGPVVNVDMYYIPTHGIAALRDDLLVTFSNATPGSPLGTSTVAVSHRLACPAP